MSETEQILIAVFLIFLRGGIGSGQVSAGIPLFTAVKRMG